jgi:hypothetical protein
MFISLFLLSTAMVSVASAEELIKEFKGRTSKTTAEFEVEAPWIIDWRTRGDYPGSMAFELTLVSSPSGQYVGKVATTKWVDNGVKMFNESGRYKLQVDTSLMDWTIRIQQLTRQEAEDYSVKRRASSPD